MPGVIKGPQVGTYYEIPKHHQRHIGHERPPWHKRLWDKPRSQVLRRNPISWGKIIVAYILFYLALILFYLICWRIYYLTVSLSLPRTLLGQPGLMFEPVCEVLHKPHYIEYNVKHKHEVNCYVNRIKTFLNKFGKKRNFGECKVSKNYGYTDQNPCIFLKITRTLGFKLKSIEKISDLPSAAPQELKSYLSTLSVDKRKSRLWISCQNVKKDGLGIQYFPQRQILASDLQLEKSDSESSEKYNEDDFNRIIAVQLTNIPVNKNIKIKCSVWAKNIERDSSAFVGPGKGYLQVDIKIKT